MSDTVTATKWAIDPAHSEVKFKVKHLVISTVTGQFREIRGKVESEGNGFDGASVYFEADVNSIDTGNEDRDAHLKSEDFFKADEYPSLTFESKNFKSAGDNDYEVTGDITIRGTTKPITLKATHGGTVQDPYGNTKAGFEISGELNRKDFGLEWNAVTEAGNVVVGDKVKLALDVQLIKEAG
jgi:polyisoprenoid-binding protein YceI